MTKHYNKTSEKEKRRALRQAQTYAEEILWQQYAIGSCWALNSDGNIQWINMSSIFMPLN